MVDHGGEIGDGMGEGDRDRHVGWSSRGMQSGKNREDGGGSIEKCTCASV